MDISVSRIVAGLNSIKLPITTVYPTLCFVRLTSNFWLALIPSPFPHCHPHCRRFPLQIAFLPFHSLSLLLSFLLLLHLRLLLLHCVETRIPRASLQVQLAILIKSLLQPEKLFPTVLPLSPTYGINIHLPLDFNLALFTQLMPFPDDLGDLEWFVAAS